MSEYVGLEWTKELEASLHRDHIREIHRFRAEDTIAKLKANKPYDSLLGSMIESSIVVALKSKKNPSIVALGKNVPEDLFTDNWGQFLASFIQAPSLGVVGYPMKQSSGAVYLTETNYGAYGGQFGGWWNYSNGSCSGTGFQFQFGSGATAATRGDFNIQTAFGASPESAVFDCGLANYSGGYITVANSIPAGGSGTINELVMFMICKLGSLKFLMSRDIVTAVPFTAGNVLIASVSIAI
jgi:hypothetical protein